VPLRAAIFSRPPERGQAISSACEQARHASACELMNVPLFRLASVLCFLAVALGAFGAHALKGTLQAHETTEIWKTAVLYHFLHGLALLALGAFPATNKISPVLFVAGIVIFSGSLYLLALTNIKWLGAITPLGGLCFLAGWLWLAIRPPL
jgi:uncharacterized membrane protein YgdD (TMEM256/DUF423 family)